MNDTDQPMVPQRGTDTYLALSTSTRLPGKPGKIQDIWDAITSDERQALAPLLLNKQVPASTLALILEESGYKVSATSLKDWRRSVYRKPDGTLDSTLTKNLSLLNAPPATQRSLTPLLDALTAVNQSPATHVNETSMDGNTTQFEIKPDGTINVEFNTSEPDVDQSWFDSDQFLHDHGFDPHDYKLTGGVTQTRDPKGNITRSSHRWSFLRKTQTEKDKETTTRRQENLHATRVEDLLPLITSPAPTLTPTINTRTQALVDTQPKTAIIHIGDLQVGKDSREDSETVIRRTIACLDDAVTLYQAYQQMYHIESVYIAWVGDCIEGFQSQGGQNAWRTQLPLTDQIRVVRRLMTHAIKLFAPLTPRLMVSSVPGNHDEAVRFAKSGVTTYSDSFATDALASVAETFYEVSQESSTFDHVEFYLPQTDELVTAIDCSGTLVATHHGHKWRPGGHFGWWKGQSFCGVNTPGGTRVRSRLNDAHLLLAGHYHHAQVDVESDRTFIQCPSMESDSTWWRHIKGSRSNPGLMFLITGQGSTPVIQLVQPTSKEQS